VQIRQNTYYRLWTGLLAALSIGIIFSANARAADPIESMTISPVDGRHTIAAGSSAEGTLTVLNDGETAYDFVVYSSPYGVTDTQYTPDFATEQSNADAYKWVQFPQTKWHIESRQTIEVPFTIAVPAGSAPGGHYGIIFAEVQPSSGDGGSVARKKRVGSILYVTVDGQTSLVGETKSIKIDWLQHQSPLRATMTVGNTGNTDFIATQTMTVADVFGRTIHQQSKEVTVLPDRPRDSSLEWSGAPWLGLYRVTVTSAVLDKTTKDSSFVLIAPVWFLVLVVVACGAGVIYAIRGRKTRR